VSASESEHADTSAAAASMATVYLTVRIMASRRRGSYHPRRAGRVSPRPRSGW
jgi:hypothetical protein